MLRSERARGEWARDAPANPDHVLRSASCDADASARNTFIGVVFLCLGIGVYSLQDIVIKYLAPTYPALEIVFIRSLISIPLLLIIIGIDPAPPRLKTNRPILHAVRGLCLFTAYMSFYLALAAMKLADVVAIAFSAPLVITVLSVVFLGEKVGLKRWGAVMLGFAGVLIMIRPGSGVFEPAALLAVLCAVVYGVAQTMTKPLGRGDGGAQMALYATVVYLIVSLSLSLWLGDGHLANNVSHPSMAFLLRAWVMPGPVDMWLIVSTGLISGIGMYALAQAYRYGEASAVAPFEYTGLVWALVLGYIVFGELPDALGLAGIALIVAAGLLVIQREKRRDRPIVTRRGRLRIRSGL